MKTLAVENNKSVPANTPSVLLESQGQMPDLVMDQVNINQDRKQYSVVLYSSLFKVNNYKISVKGDHLQIVLTEHTGFSKPLYSHHFDWTLYNQQMYDRYHNITLRLSNSNDLVIHHELNESNGQLAIVIGMAS